MKPALENRIREAIRAELADDPNIFKTALDAAILLVAARSQGEWLESQVRAVWDKYFAITEAN